MKRAGFTLIEILVVLSVIGALVAIVLFSVGSARERGQETRELADDSQIELAITLYRQQHNISQSEFAGSSGPTVDELVPDFLAAVPDQYIGQRMCEFLGNCN